jgi:alpha-L-fucosidase
VEDQEYKTSVSLIHDLIDIVSKNGALLLNIGPRADGTIPDADRQILLDIGNWLAVNGEAIYATRPWKIFGEGPTEIIEGAFQDEKRAEFTGRDVRFTTKGETLYAIVMGQPETGEVLIESLRADQNYYPDAIRRVELLGKNETVLWSRDSTGLKAKLPPRSSDAAACVLKIEKE